MFSINLTNGVLECPAYIEVNQKFHLGNCAPLAVGVVLPRDMVGGVQPCENSVPEPQQLVRQMASAAVVVHYLLTTLWAGLMGGRVED